MTQSYLTQLYTNTLSNQNISSALNTGTYTEPGTRLRKLFITLFADQIAGNGNYTAYVTRQIAGAGSAYEVGQRTIVAVPSGVTAQAFQTIAVLCGVSDVIKTYILGLGGDTTTPDIITNVVEEFVGVGADGNALISTDTQDLSSTLSVNTKKVNGTTQTARDLGLALPAAAPNAAGGLLITAAGSLDMDDIGADVDAIETRVTTALPNAAPQAAGGLVTSTAGSLDFDDLAADVDATETRVVLALPAAAPQAAGGLITSIAGSFDIDEMNADVEAIQTGVAAIPTTDNTSNISAIKTQTDKLTFTVTNQIDANVLDWKSATAPAMTGDAFARLGAPAGASVSADILEANADLDELITTIGVAGAGLTAVTVDALSAAALADFFDVDSTKIYADAVDGSVVKESAGQNPATAQSVWDELIVNANTPNSIGERMGFLNTSISSRATVTDPAVAIAINPDGTVQSDLQKWHNNNFTGTVVGGLPLVEVDDGQFNAIADALLNRDMSAVTDSNDRTLLNAIRFLRNKWGISGATLTVKKEDDATTAWTATVSSDAGAVPIIGNDPA